MPKRKVHVVSDSEDDTEGEEWSPSPQKAKTASKRKPTRRDVRDDEDDEVESVSVSRGRRARKPSDDGQESRALACVDSSSAQSQMSILSLDMDENVERTPRSFKVVDAPKRGSRKLHYQMFAFVIDRSPSDFDGLEDYGNYILRRRVIDTFMRMRLDKFQKHESLVMTCCAEKTDNISNREQAKNLNKHCVEILSAEELTVEQIRELSDTPPFTPEEKQFSNVIAGLMTAADLITRRSADLEPFEKIEVTLFSDLKFDLKDPSMAKMSRVLSLALPDTRLTVIANPAAIERKSFADNLNFLKEIFAEVEVLPYKEAMRKSEEWTMAEQMPMAFRASIKIFDQEIPTEAYLACNEKNVSVLKTRMEKVTDSTQNIGVTESALREEKKLVKLSDDGHYMKDDDQRLITVDPERAAIAYKFGTTAVPTEKKLTEYLPSEPAHKGYVVRGWYPAQEFPLYVSGGRSYRVFPGSNDCALFDSLLMSCARRGYALLVDYTYQARFEPKPAVLIPHYKKRCFVHVDLVHGDNLNYLPRYDPITTIKPPAKNLKKMCDIIASSQIDHLEMKYDPQSQQVIEDCWKSEIGETAWNFHERLAEVTFKKDSKLQEKIEEFKEDAEGFSRRLTIHRKEDEPTESEALIPFNVEPLEDKHIEKITTRGFKSLFKDCKS